MLLPGVRALNAALTARLGTDVVLIESLEVGEGQTVRLRFDGGSSPWRQGVWLMTDGQLEVDGRLRSQVVIWQDGAPEVVEIGVGATDGRLRLYNVWDSGRGLGPFESQKASTGMLVTEDDGWLLYRCCDIAAEPTFDRLAFAISIVGPR